MSINKETEIRVLLERLRQGTISKTDKSRLQQLTDQEPAALNEWLDDDFAATAPLQDQKVLEDGWNRFELTINQKSKAKKRQLWYKLSAAAVVLLLICGLGWMLWQFDNFPSGQELAKNNTRLPVNIELSDGSLVVINSGSKLWYPKSFEGKERSVRLEGEAFFMIETNPDKPFIVETQSITTTVLGTQFNVNAFKENSISKVSLKEGKVKVDLPDRNINNIWLSPGEEVAYSRTDSQFIQRNFDLQKTCAWIDEVVYFDGSDVEEVIRVLKEKYGVSFVIKEGHKIHSKLKYKLSYGKYSLKEVLTHIAQITDYQFEYISKRKIVIKPD